MTETPAAPGFDPVKEFPNIVWNFDNLQDPGSAATPGTPAAAVAREVEVPNAESDVEMNEAGIMTAPPTPPALAPEVVHPSALPTANATTSAKAQKTLAKRKAVPSTVAEEPGKKKAKTAKSHHKKEAKEKIEAGSAPEVPSKEVKAKARMAKNQARKEAKREHRRQKRKEIRSKRVSEEQEEPMQEMKEPEQPEHEVKISGDDEVGANTPEKKIRENVTEAEENDPETIEEANRNTKTVADVNTEDTAKAEMAFSGRMTRRRAKMAGAS